MTKQQRKYYVRGMFSAYANLFGISNDLDTILSKRLDKIQQIIDKEIEEKLKLC